MLIVNATTGETNRYTIDAIPEWVDRVQPESFVMQQINNQGQYVHGIFNFSNQDKFRPSRGDIIIYNGARCYLFTGLTSVGSDESAIGFILVDMVTKESFLYQMSGATEVAAQSSAEGKVQQFGYRASFPMIINLDGQPTYFMTLKDNAGLIKQYAFVSVANYTNVGTGETIDSALRDFRQMRGSSGGILTGQTAKSVKGTVLRIASESLGHLQDYFGRKTQFAVHRILRSEQRAGRNPARRPGIHRLYDQRHRHLHRHRVRQSCVYAEGGGRGMIPDSTRSPHQ